jgi:hypothetical protein
MCSAQADVLQVPIADIASLIRLAQLFLNKLTGKYSERRRTIQRFFGVWGQRRDEHEEATYFGAGNSDCCVFRRISRSRWQQAKGVCGCPGFMQSSSSQKVFRHPLHEAA